MSDLKVLENLVLASVFFLYFSCKWDFAHTVEIECVPLKSCPTALKVVLKSKFSPETKEFLKVSHCGYDQKNQPKVWCSQLNFCVTPQNRNGTCTPLKKCKTFLKFRATLDTSDSQIDSFLKKFRCHEILEEDHVCCQNEEFDINYDHPFLRKTKKEQNFFKIPPMHYRFSYDDYDYYDWSSDTKSNSNNYGDTFHQSRETFYDYQETENKHDQNNKWNFDDNLDNGKWNTHKNVPHLYPKTHKQFVPYLGGNFNHFPRSPTNSDEEYYETSNNNKRGTSREEVHVNFESTERSSRDNFEHTTCNEIGTTYKQTTDRNYERATSDSSYSTTETSKNIRKKITTPSSNEESRTTRQKARTETNAPTTPSVRRTTTYSRRTTTRKNNLNVNISEGGIIFEDTFEDVLRRNSMDTEATTKSSNRISCQTPDKKSGICTPASDCHHYSNLESNLDRSEKSVKEYLSKFKCASSSDICCQIEEEAIDNSLFHAERTNENIPQDISKVCGRQTASNDRIVGGTVADLGEYPWLALLQYSSNKGIQLGCGGTLINSRYVVTAAHCVDEEILRTKGLAQVRQIILGEYDTRNKTDCIYMNSGQNCADPSKTYGVESIISHSLYNPSTTRHDIALLRLNQEVAFTDYVKPICLPTNTSSLKGNETFIIAGWGRTSSEVSSPVLKKARIPYVARENCNGRNRTLAEGQICAGLGNGTDSCNGDSGGPLMLEVNFNFEFVTHLVGVISYGFLGCGKGPSVNTYVPYYVDWINENIKL